MRGVFAFCSHPPGCRIADGVDVDALCLRKSGQCVKRPAFCADLAKARHLENFVYSHSTRITHSQHSTLQCNCAFRLWLCLALSPQLQSTARICRLTPDIGDAPSTPITRALDNCLCIAAENGSWLHVFNTQFFVSFSLLQPYIYFVSLHWSHDLSILIAPLDQLKLHTALLRHCCADAVGF